MRRRSPLALLPLLLAGASFAAVPGEEPPEVRYAAMLAAEYGPLGTTAAQILGREPTHEAATIVGALVYRIRAKPAERLSAVEKRLLAVADLRAEVNEGGFQQYFSEAAGNQSALALQAYQEMGATSLARILQRAMSVFPNAKPPATPEGRQTFIARARRRVEAAWCSCDDEFYLRDEAYAALALEYAKKHRSQIVLP